MHYKTSKTFKNEKLRNFPLRRLSEIATRQVHFNAINKKVHIHKKYKFKTHYKNLFSVLITLVGKQE